MNAEAPKLENLKAKLRASIDNRDLLLRLKNEFGYEVLKDTTLGNWRIRGEIPNAAVDGAILGSVLPPDGLENIPAELLEHRWGDIKIRGLWARSVWHILRVGEEEESAQGARNLKKHSGTMWHVWEDISALPAHMLPKPRQILGKSWLLHFSEGEPGNMIDRADTIPPGDPAATVKAAATEDLVAYERAVEFYDAKSLEKTSKSKLSGYWFTARNSFRARREEEWAFERFGGRAAIPVEKAHVVVSVPKQSVALNSFYPLVPAKTFATNRSKILENYAKKALSQNTLSTTGDEFDSFESGLFATWGETFSAELQSRSKDLGFLQVIDPSIVDLKEEAERLKKKEQLSRNESEQRKFKSQRDDAEKERTDLEEKVLESFFAERHVFHATFPLPNPLSYQKVFWPLPDAR